VTVGPGAFSYTDVRSLDWFTGLVGLGDVVDITHTAAGTTSLDVETSFVPEPATTSLMILGLLSAGYARRRCAQ
jgi:hypothetical protein